MNISVVIPAWTETLDHFAMCLDSLPDFCDPIIVFNGPDAESHADEGHVLPPGPGCYLCRARNYGVSLATTEYIAFLDADDFLLDGFTEVAKTAAGHDGAWGQMLVANEEMERMSSQMAGQAHMGSFVIRREIVPEFDIWAPHQVGYRGKLWNSIWWAQIDRQDFIHVPVETMVYRYNWSPKTATNQYWEHGGFIGEPNG